MPFFAQFLNSMGDAQPEVQVAAEEVVVPAEGRSSRALRPCVRQVAERTSVRAGAAGDEGESVEDMERRVKEMEEEHQKLTELQEEVGKILSPSLVRVAVAKSPRSHTLHPYA